MLLEPFRDKFKNFARFSCKGIKLRFVLQGSPFRYGKIWASFRPLHSAIGYGKMISATGSTIDPGYVNAAAFAAGGMEAYDATSASRDIDAFPFFSGGHHPSDVCDGYFRTSTTGNAYYPGFSARCFGGSLMHKSILMNHSTRMGVWLDVADSTSAELTIPFIHYKDCVDIAGQITAKPTLGKPTSCTQFSQPIANMVNMGTLFMDLPHAIRTATTASAEKMTLNIFAQFIEPKLWAADNPFVLQAEDEFDEQTTVKPSAVASTIAEAASLFEWIPIIGPYAKATSMAASAVSWFLGLFGWTNPPVVTPIPSRMLHTSYISPNPDISTQEAVLALDAKNETTVDPRTVGCSPSDPLAIEEFCARPAYVGSLYVDGATAPDTTIATIPITSSTFGYRSVSDPGADPRFGTAIGTGASKKVIAYQTIPFTYASALFKYWRGTCVLRFVPIVSKFHRGAIRIWYSPTFRGSANCSFTEGTHVNYVHQLQDGEFTIRVPFSTSNSFLLVDHSPFTFNDDTSGDKYNNRWSLSESIDYPADAGKKLMNGVVGVQMLNWLQSPVAAPVDIMVFCHFEDVEFACPILNAMSDKGKSQSGTDFEAGLDKVAMAPFCSQSNDVCLPTDKKLKKAQARALLYPGEQVFSLRKLLHRSTPYRVFVNYPDPGSASGRYGGYAPHTLYTLDCYLPRFPLPTAVTGRGYAPDAVVNAADVTTSSHYVTNLSKTTPIAYLSACFTGHRGSLIWSAKAHSDLITDISISRADIRHPTYCYKPKVELSGASMVSNVTGFDRNAASNMTRMGLILTQRESNSSVNGKQVAKNKVSGYATASFPSYSNWRMLPGNAAAMHSNTYLFGGWAASPAPETMDSATSDIAGVKVTAEFTPQATGFGASGTTMPNQFSAGLAVATAVRAGPDFNVYGFISVPTIFIYNTNAGVSGTATCVVPYAFTA
jgi:hypothetical protein